MVNGVAVMRRRSDSYLNATQILKVGGVDKGRRTKILEKEIHTGEHEKVQGGYGKYQGTWIPFLRGREFCRQYAVEDVLLPLLDFDPAAPQSEQTPTKEQAMAARRKQMYAVQSAQSSMTSQTQGSQQSFAAPLSVSATAALTALGKAASRAEAANEIASRQSTEVMVSFSGETATDVDEEELAYGDGPPRKRSRTETDSGVTATDPDHLSQQKHQQPQDLTRQSANTREQPLEPLDQYNLGPTYDQSKQIMTQIFMTNETSGVSQISLLDGANTPHVDVDVAIDDLGHASLHWAAALARVQLVRDLVARGADPRRGNYIGETALVRAVTVTNNLDQATFPAVLDLLHPAIVLADKSKRTVLHHIALTAGIKGRAAASRYYLECLLEWIVRHGSSEQGGLGLGKFMSEVVNARDKNGDTSLNIAARIGNKAIVQQLLEVGADASIPNRAGLRPVDFGIGPEVGAQLLPPSQWLRGSAALVPPAVQQKSKDIIACMLSVLLYFFSKLSL